MHLLAALAWDPQIRGFLIVLTAVAILPGSVYLLLSTNLGARVGFSVAVAAATGWITIMAVTWALFGIGLKGEEAHWDVKEIVTGSLSQSTVGAIDGFPREWKPLKLGEAELADAQAAADKVLGPNAATTGGHEGGGEEVDTLRFPSPFKLPTDYVVIGGFRKGGDNELFSLRNHKFFFRHSPHYAIVQVRPVVEVDVPEGGTPPKPEADTTKPVTSVVMERNLGALRLPSLILALCSLTVFGVACWSLHERDREIAMARAES